jgi:uncharacterized membrane protein required for colicin V production
MDSYPPPGRNLTVWLPLLALLGAALGFCLSEKDYVAASVVGVAAFGGLWGYYLGAFRLLGALGAVVAAYEFTTPAARWLSPRLADAFGTAAGTTWLLSVILAALGIAALITAAVEWLSRRLTYRRRQLDAGNRLLGFGVGAAEGAVFMLLLLSGLVATARPAHERLESLRPEADNSLGRAMSDRVVRVAALARRSVAAPLVVNHNPFDAIPQLKRVQRTIAVVNDPQALTGMAEHPALAKLQDNPTVRAAVESLANDPQLRELALSGKSIDGKTVLALLNNPSIARLLERPELVRDIAAALGDMDGGVWESFTKSAVAGP